MRVDVAVIGSGFGGGVAALRLVEKGDSVAVLEAGRRVADDELPRPPWGGGERVSWGPSGGPAPRFADDELPRTSWDVRRFLWAPALGCHGIQRIDLLGTVLVLSGAGVGGGSLVYGNTLYRPPPAFFAAPPWAGITDWADELA